MKVMNADNYYGGEVQHHNWSPYSDNGGNVVAIAGEDFAIIASDTRLSVGYSILTREQSKISKLSDKTVLGCTGCWCDILTFKKILKARMQMYDHEHNKVMGTTAVAQLAATMLYYKRFFPYYITNILAGLDNEGKGCVFTYDPVGHCEREMYGCGGSASALVLPLLDNQVGLKNMEGIEQKPISKQKALEIIKDAFISAAERDIYTGDGVIINIITKDGITEEKFPLRRD